MTVEFTPWAKKQIESTETSRRLVDGKDNVEDFAWLHLSCGDQVVQEDMGTVNSNETDPATGDPKPLFRTRLHCNMHDVSSATQEKLGE